MECEKTNPGAVFILEKDYESLKPVLGSFLKEAVRDVIEIPKGKKSDLEVWDFLKGFQERKRTYRRPRSLRGYVES